MMMHKELFLYHKVIVHTKVPSLIEVVFVFSYQTTQLMSKETVT